MSQVEVVLQQTDEETDLPTQAQFQTWVDTALNAANNTLPVSCNEICITITDKTKSAELNQTFRSKQGPTNVLAFPSMNIPGFEQNSLGDLVICAPIVTEEALTQKKPRIAHWAHLTVHGTLHLLGYDHIEQNEAEIMESLEISALASLQFPNPYEDCE